MGNTRDGRDSIMEQLNEYLQKIDKAEQLSIAADNLRSFSTIMLMTLTAPTYLKAEEAEGLRQSLENDNNLLSKDKIFQKRLALQNNKKFILNYLEKISDGTTLKHKETEDITYLARNTTTLLNELSANNYRDRPLETHNTYNLTARYTRYLSDELLAEHRRKIEAVAGSKTREPMSKTHPERLEPAQPPENAKMESPTPVQQPTTARYITDELLAEHRRKIEVVAGSKTREPMSKTHPERLKPAQQPENVVKESPTATRQPMGTKPQSPTPMRQPMGAKPQSPTPTRQPMGAKPQSPTPTRQPMGDKPQSPTPVRQPMGGKTRVPMGQQQAGLFQHPHNTQQKVGSEKTATPPSPRKK